MDYQQQLQQQLKLQQQQQQQQQQQVKQQQQQAKHQQQANAQALAIQNLLKSFNPGTDYNVTQVIGQGAYGTVCSAKHIPSGVDVAIKRIGPFDSAMLCQRTLREIKLLKHFNHENIITIYDVVNLRPRNDFNYVYIVQELLDIDLHRIIKTQPLSEEHVQYFLYQILRALKSIHSCNVLHRDLKPANILLNANCDLKVCDFGLARGSNDDNEKSESFLTEYVATRWYRAPEIMLSFKEYTKAIDIWSVGCIMAEMLSKMPLFPGRDYHHQLKLIFDVLGTPRSDAYLGIKSQRARDYICSLPFKAKANFSKMFPYASPLAIDLMDKMLNFNPKKRITVEEALAHPYLAQYHDEADEPTCPPLPENFFDFDNFREKLSVEQLKDLLWNEIHSNYDNYDQADSLEGSELEDEDM
ncbi:mitogen activated protein kinase [Coemansia biformis]|uniref:Mitogen-activated protein kinase n=1 Tax=Coemansia biformis TaxID=1286918 RepID=A0A9W7YCT8_9FUNG|nr:mitogen activated protein kinase [Coemansia biformis]